MLLNVISFWLHPDTKSILYHLPYPAPASWPVGQTQPTACFHQIYGFSPAGDGEQLFGKEGFWNNVGPPHIPEGAGQPLLVPLAWRWGGARRAQQGDSSWGLAQNTDQVPRFFQDWTTLSRFGRMDRTPVFGWTAQKYLKMTPRIQKAPCDDPFSPFTKFRLTGACCQAQHLLLLQSCSMCASAESLWLQN